ncbi:hypothetical protein COT44_01540 [Candidatus Shapirobacteria bacterium CG08_land_8_20_14_0_20_39_18]|uniref:Uncharacterized protein n=1 Tax=Candidatus Shapirobacteria bacterium CG08_land_8_20_14_0_20_39_18 TaxID=1974883 RepID=A0A2M6XDI2_9BACT|nr:MAG: hypothetical protein COT44_01540 [Candidatus Shapirobacteria bacterium CG08_land_8_20_14_0_20_39_18]PIY65155.1 MAG: hypothetical protein COY91_03800 [Candidatus Shapirobacteria bacterium CG_4_10_14_0_8_um_filter_39_15]PJE68011.1 MAG: hypothetical protein COU94_04235 [Candidatus Shapirobacteria bacterium CG10_big_fil_rev_8_21_14_0_10_38_8]
MKVPREFESPLLRQLGNVFVGSPSARGSPADFKRKLEFFIFAPKGMAKSGLPEFLIGLFSFYLLVLRWK